MYAKFRNTVSAIIFVALIGCGALASVAEPSQDAGDPSRASLLLETTGSGTSTDPFLVSTASDLRRMKNYPSAYFLLTNDIDTDDGTSWSTVPEFSGVLDGNGYTIYQGKGNQTDSQDSPSSYRRAGLIGHNTGTVRNLHISTELCSYVRDANKTHEIAPLVSVNAGVVENCSSDGSIRLINTLNIAYFTVNSSGLVATNHGTIRNCHANVSQEISAEKYGTFHFAGLVCQNYGLIQNSYARTTLCYYTNTSGGAKTESSYYIGNPSSPAYTNWDFHRIWYVSPDINGGYPVLRSIRQWSAPAPPAEYTITFDANDGQLTSIDDQRKIVFAGETYGDLPVPVRDEYDFTGWYTEQSGGTRVTASTPVELTGNQILFAQWTPKPTYTVTFDPNGGTVDTASKIVMKDYSYGALPEPSWSRYTFDGWYTSITGGRRVTESTMVSITTNQTLYAHWTLSTYTITFDPNGGTVDLTCKDVFRESTYGTLPTPVLAHHTFDGWYTSATGGSLITELTKVDLAGDQILYAHWLLNTYTITFDSNGGNLADSSKIVASGSVYGSLPTPTREHFAFIGWYTSPSEGTRVSESTAVNITENQTLYAHWTLDPQTPSGQSFSGGTGTQADPFQIGSADQLILMRDLVNSGDEFYASANYCLIQSIDLNGISWTPIGTSQLSYYLDGPKFQGTFDGRGQIISNLTIDSTKTNYVGLFGLATNATIKGVFVYNGNVNLCPDFSLELYCGLLVGRAGNCEITGCAASGSIVINSLGSLDVGGLVGYQSSGTIKYSRADVSIYESTYDTSELRMGYAGGLVGNSTGAISNCMASGDIRSYLHAIEAGGLVGYASKSVVNCYALGDVTGECSFCRYGGGAEVGGLIGEFYGEGLVDCSYSAGNVSATTGYGDACAGGIIGRQSLNEKPGSYFLSTLCSHCFSVGNVSAYGKSLSDSHIGYIIGRANTDLDKISYSDEYTLFKDCYYNASAVAKWHGNPFPKNDVGDPIEWSKFLDVAWITNELGFDTQNTWACPSGLFPLLRPGVVGMLVKSTPQKNVYLPGEEITTDGLELEVYDSEYARTAVKSGYSISTTVATEGQEAIEITYKDQKAYIPVVIAQMNDIKLQGSTIAIAADKPCLGILAQYDGSGKMTKVTIREVNNSVDSFDVSGIEHYKAFLLERNTLAPISMLESP